MSAVPVHPAFLPISAPAMKRFAPRRHHPDNGEAERTLKDTGSPTACCRASLSLNRDRPEPKTLPQGERYGKQHPHTQARHPCDDARIDPGAWIRSLQHATRNQTAAQDSRKAFGPCRSQRTAPARARNPWRTTSSGGGAADGRSLKHEYDHFAMRIAHVCRHVLDGHWGLPNASIRLS